MVVELQQWAGRGGCCGEVSSSCSGQCYTLGPAAAAVLWLLVQAAHSTFLGGAHSRRPVAH